MRYKITQRGVYDQNGNPVPVGSLVEVGASCPAWLLNKAEPVPEPEKPVAVINPKKA